jgi:hypothetical protein
MSWTSSNNNSCQHLTFSPGTNNTNGKKLHVPDECLREKKVPEKNHISLICRDKSKVPYLILFTEHSCTIYTTKDNFTDYFVQDFNQLIDHMS